MHLFYTAVFVDDMGDTVDRQVFGPFICRMKIAMIRLKNFAMSTRILFTFVGSTRCRRAMTLMLFWLRIETRKGVHES